jgi:hypothetical protein
MRLLITTLIAVAAFGLAQDKAKPAAKSQQQQQAAPNPMNVPQVPEMARLEKTFAGSWSLDEKFEAMPGMPGMDQGGTGKGRETIKRGPNGNSLVADLTSTSTMGPFTGHGLMWWDGKAYRSIWCDSGTPWCDESMKGKWVGNDLVFEGDSPLPKEMGGGVMHMVQKFSDIKPGSFTFTIDGGPKGKPMAHMMTIKYARVGK